MGYVFNKDYQRSGYATEVTKAKLMERLKMRREAHHIKNTCFFIDEKGDLIWQDTYKYATRKEKWQLDDNYFHE